MMNYSTRKRMEFFFRAMELAHGEKDYSQYTQALDDFITLAEKAGEELAPPKPKRNRKVKQTQVMPTVSRKKPVVIIDDPYGPRGEE